jgi:hypothetical protein
MFFGIIVVAILGIAIPAIFSGLAWGLFGLNKAKLSLKGAVIVFIPGALTSFVFYGHAGPVPVLMMLWMKANGQYLPWVLWMSGSGVCTVILFGWLSYRRARVA